MNIKKQKENEKKFKKWDQTSENGRIYWFDIKGRNGWSARYVKIVDKNENTLNFFQEIYNDKCILVEVHEKYPEDKGHKQV